MNWERVQRTVPTADKLLRDAYREIYFYYEPSAINYDFRRNNGLRDMNRESTKADLLSYLEDEKIRVLALMGLWGTGKTHLWEEIKKHYKPSDKDDSLYVSCFGLESIEQIRVALFQNSLGKAEKVVGAAKKMSGVAVDIFEKIASKMGPGAEGVPTVIGSLGGLVQAALIDKTLNSRLIVLDDIERRGALLQIDAILGFVDLLKRNDCKILLILNEEPLEARSSDWRVLKEKGLDREIRLIISPEEAAGIGLSQELRFHKTVTEMLVQLSVTNIRVIQRIDRIVNTIFDEVVTISDDVLQPMLRAAVTLTALNFNAVPNGPDLSELMKEWVAWCARPATFFPGSDSSMSPAVQFAVKVKLTRDIEFLGILRQSILTGHRFKEKISELLRLRSEQENYGQAVNAAENYIHSIHFNPCMEDQDFIDLAKSYGMAWRTLSASDMSAIVNDLEGRGEAIFAQEIAENWAQNWLELKREWNSSITPLDGLNSIVKKAILEGNRLLSVEVKLVDAVVAMYSGHWETNFVNVVNGASVDEVIDAIYSLDGETFGSFILFYKDQFFNPVKEAGGGALFEPGVNSFLQAVRCVMRENKKARLTMLLQNHLGERIPDDLTFSNRPSGGAEGDEVADRELRMRQSEINAGISCVVERWKDMRTLTESGVLFRSLETVTEASLVEHLNMLLRRDPVVQGRLRGIGNRGQATDEDIQFLARQFDALEDDFESDDE